MPIFGDDGGRREMEKRAKAEGRLPPGQSLTIKWPVLHYGSVPRFDPATWDFKISGLVETPLASNLAGISRHSANRIHQRFSLRHALEPFE